VVVHDDVFVAGVVRGVLVRVPSHGASTSSRITTPQRHSEFAGHLYHLTPKKGVLVGLP
jgi:hypothetical protein